MHKQKSQKIEGGISTATLGNISKKQHKVKSSNFKIQPFVPATTKNQEPDLTDTISDKDTSAVAVQKAKQSLAQNQASNVVSKKELQKKIAAEKLSKQDIVFKKKTVLRPRKENSIAKTKAAKMKGKTPVAPVVDPSSDESEEDSSDEEEITPAPTKAVIAPVADPSSDESEEDSSDEEEAIPAPTKAVTAPTAKVAKGKTLEITPAPTKAAATTIADEETTDDDVEMASGLEGVAVAIKHDSDSDSVDDEDEESEDEITANDANTSGSAAKRPLVSSTAEFPEKRQKVKSEDFAGKRERYFNADGAPSKKVQLKPRVEIFCGGLPFQVTEDQIRELFENDCGLVTRVSILENRGVSFVTFETEEAASKACEFNKTTYEGRSLRINYADEKPGAVSGRNDKAPTGRSVIIGNLSFGSTQESLRALFEECGNIDDIRIPVFEDTGKPRGRCFIDFETEEGAKKALEYNETDIDGRTVWIDYVRPREDKPSNGFRGGRGGRGGFGGRGGGFGGGGFGGRGGGGGFGGRGGGRGRGGYGGRGGPNRAQAQSRGSIQQFQGKSMTFDD
ncbi:Rna recognition motif-containing protein [Cardiosporidium cionae]|uniref:Rna recognition motif-containing protein n=1 Tax=Cardiosporidium cionae TaxID=476202 RepID=A0ABQ7J9Z7_9APIC|nr:Rna recognition motif-containing protein [Cardiosporidium cionae]|eukprot:KAF8820826.1 Rna recognition motif-containing protein [Cardiosporidium cionae]